MFRKKRDVELNVAKKPENNAILYSVPLKKIDHYVPSNISRTFLETRKPCI